MVMIEARDARIPPQDEQLAREIVSPYLNAALVCLSESGHEPIPDFALYRGANQIGWLEVTTATDQGTRTLFGQLELLGHKLTTDRLRYDWFLLLARSTSEPSIERDSLTRFGFGSWTSPTTQPDIGRGVIQSPTRFSTSTTSPVQARQTKRQATLSFGSIQPARCIGSTQIRSTGS